MLQIAIMFLCFYVIVGFVFGIALTATGVIDESLSEYEGIGVSIPGEARLSIYLLIWFECVFFWPMVLSILSKLLRANDLAWRDLVEVLKDSF